VKAIDQSQVAARGLTSADADRLLSEYGPNELTPARRAANVIQILRLFANPLIIILLIASLVSGLLGERVNAAIIVVMVLFSVASRPVRRRLAERPTVTL
jgi:P-type Mg2+ transporter